MLGALKAGDKVITNGGIYGTINGLDGDTVILKIADQVKIRVARSAICRWNTEDANKVADRFPSNVSMLKVGHKESIPSDMNPNLKWKALFISLVILGCIYGFIRLPTFPTSLAELKDNFSHQIQLGMDLQGGTHLILQVQMQEAIAQKLINN